jgi:hypothetical protein
MLLLCLRSACIRILRQQKSRSVISLRYTNSTNQKEHEQTSRITGLVDFVHRPGIRDTRKHKLKKSKVILVTGSGGL